MSHPPYGAILFDFDGVLADTMSDHFRAWQKSLNDFGANLLPEEYYPFEGLAMPELAKEYCRKNHIPEANAEKILISKENYYIQDYEFRLYPGVEDFIGLLKEKNFPIAIVTTGLKDRLFKSVPSGFLGKFNKIVTGDDVDRGKPFPDPYLKAAANLNIPIEKCVVAENSPMGIKSAKTAGAYCIGIASTLRVEYLHEADEVIKSFLDLKNTKAIKELSFFN